MKQRPRAEFSKLDSQDLLNILFRQPYMRIEFLVSELGVTRQTAAKHLDPLAEAGFLRQQRAGRIVLKLAF